MAAAKLKIRRYHVPPKYRDYFTSNLALLLAAAVPVQEALVSLQETTKSKELLGALEQMKHDIDDGLPLWKAMERSGIVSGQTLTLVRLGEQSGTLVANLRVAAKQEQKQLMFRGKIRSAMLYPSFVLGLTGIVGIGVAWFLLPRLSVTFTQLGADLPAISKILINLGVFLKANGFWAVPTGLLVLALIFVVLFVLPKTKIIGQRLLFHIPGVSRLLHEVEIARFGYLFGTLLEAGLPVTHALRSLEEATFADGYKRLYRHLLDSFENGYSFKAAFPRYKHSTNLLPAPVQQMVIAGERSGSLSETLLEVGSIYEEKVDLSTQNLETILEPILLVIVWAGVMGVAVAVIMPIYSLVGGLGT